MKRNTSPVKGDECPISILLTFVYAGVYTNTMKTQKEEKAMRLAPLHEEREPEKTKLLMESMKVNGWAGSPLVRDGEQLITGTHRYLAAQNLGIAPPTIELDELFARAGLNMQGLHEKHGYPTIDEPEWDDFLMELPVSVREKYGIQVR